MHDSLHLVHGHRYAAVKGIRLPGLYVWSTTGSYSKKVHTDIQKGKMMPNMLLLDGTTLPLWAPMLAHAPSLWQSQDQDGFSASNAFAALE